MNPPIIHAGLDVAKASFVLHFAGKNFTLCNTKIGHRQLVAILEKHPGVQVVVEASGGYERGIFDALCAANIPASILNPRQVYHFAKSLGDRAKTDLLDAQLLAIHGERMRPAPTAPRTASQRELCELVRHRRSLLDTIVAQRHSMEQVESAPLRRELTALVRQMEARLSKIEALIKKHQSAHEELRAKAQRLMQVAGVGELTALAGLAPYARESGAWKGARCIAGGRPAIRRALYMAALSAARHHTALSAFYQRLRAAGKPYKIAITALMRKLLILLTLALKNPDLTLAN